MSSTPPTASPPPDPVAVARTPADLERLRPAWERLQRHPNADLDLQLALLASRGDTVTPWVLALGHAAAPRALLVARLQHTRLPVRFGYRTLLRPRVRALEVLHGGILGEVGPAEAATLAGALATPLRSGLADLVTFEHTPMAAPLLAAVRTTGGAAVSAPREEPVWRTAIPADWQTFLGARSANTRRNLRRYPQRFLAAHGSDHRVVVYRDPGDLDRILGDLDRVAARTYQHGLGAGFRGDAERRALLSLSLQKNWYRAWVLYVGDRPIAFWDGRLYRGTMFTDTTGYLPEFEDSRPGWFLLARMLQDLCADPEATAVDFGVGDAQYKRMLCEQPEAHSPLLWFAPTWRGRRLRWLCGTARAMEGAARWTAKKLGLTGRIKKWWRRRLRSDRHDDPS